MTKSKKSPAEKIKAGRAKMAASPLGQLADTVLGFALPVGKVKAAAAGLRAAGKTAQAAALEARIAAKVGGQIAKRASAIGNAGRGPFSAANFAKENAAIKSITNRDITAAGARAASESLFPKLPSKGGDAPGMLRGSRDTRTFDKYADPINEGAGRFKSQNLLDTIIQGSKTRSGMNQVKVASEVAKKLAKYKTPKRGR
jgi:hypothetical protein